MTLGEFIVIVGVAETAASSHSVDMRGKLKAESVSKHCPQKESIDGERMDRRRRQLSLWIIKPSQHKGEPYTNCSHMRPFQRTVQLGRRLSRLFLGCHLTTAVLW